MALLFVMVINYSADAQVRKCGRFSLQDAQMPSYPPIARAAHMEATYRFRVLIKKAGEAQVSLLDGPSQGVWQILSTAALVYVTSRTYDSLEIPKPCTYNATVQYRFVKGHLDFPNNFFRVTVMDEAHTLVEVESTTPTVNYY